MLKWWGPAILSFFLVGSMLFFTTPAKAQTPEPTPTSTPTPVYEYDLALPSGTHVAVERRITYGDIAIVIAIMAVTVCFIIYFMIRVVKLWLR